MYRLLTFLTLICTIAISPVSADENAPSAVEICRAAGEVYFFTGEPPSAEPDRDGWVLLTSARGNVYRCRFVGDRVAFSWKNETGDMMESTSTRIEMSEGRFEVITDLVRRMYDW